MANTKKHLNNAQAATKKYLSRPRWRNVAIFALGLLVGWFIFGWVLFPVQYTNVYPNELHPEVVNDYLVMTAENYAATGDLRTAAKRLHYWPEQELKPMFDGLIQSYQSTDPAVAGYLQRLANDLHLDKEAQNPPPKSRSFNFLWLIYLVLGLAVLAILLFIAERMGWIGRPAEEPEPLEAAPPPETRPVRQEPKPSPLPIPPGDEDEENNGPEDIEIIEEPEEIAPPPQPDDELSPPLTVEKHILHFDGDPAFNTIVAIESGDDYLGEYGLSVGHTAPSNPNLVITLEVWLFDKGDTQTTDIALVPPVVATDPDLRARYTRENTNVIPLKVGQIFVLETAELRLEGRVRRVQFGATTSDGVPVIESAEIEMLGRRK